MQISQNELPSVGETCNIEKFTTISDLKIRDSVSLSKIKRLVLYVPL